MSNIRVEKLRELFEKKGNSCLHFDHKAIKENASGTCNWRDNVLIDADGKKHKGKNVSFSWAGVHIDAGIKDLATRKKKAKGSEKAALQYLVHSSDLGYCLDFLDNWNTDSIKAGLKDGTINWDNSKINSFVQRKAKENGKIITPIDPRARISIPFDKDGNVTATISRIFVRNGTPVIEKIDGITKYNIHEYIKYGDLTSGSACMEQLNCHGFGISNNVVLTSLYYKSCNMAAPPDPEDFMSNDELLALATTEESAPEQKEQKEENTTSDPDSESNNTDEDTQTNESKLTAYQQIQAGLVPDDE